MYLADLAARYLADRQAAAGARSARRKLADSRARRPECTAVSMARVAGSAIEQEGFAPMVRSVSVAPPAKRAVHAFSLSAGRLTSRARMLPAFLIVGAQRCGTTSMYRTLCQHPAVVKAVLHKGVHYFDMAYDRGPGWYQAHFPLAGRGTAHQEGRRGARR